MLLLRMRIYINIFIIIFVLLSDFKIFNGYYYITTAIYIIHFPAHVLNVSRPFTRAKPISGRAYTARTEKYTPRWNKTLLILFLLAIAGAASLPNQVYAHDQGAVETAVDVCKKG